MISHLNVLLASFGATRQGSPWCNLINLYEVWASSLSLSPTATPLEHMPINIFFFNVEMDGRLEFAL